MTFKWNAYWRPSERLQSQSWSLPRLFFISSSVLNQCSLLFPPLEWKCVNVEMRGGNFTKKQRHFFPNSQGKESLCIEKFVMCDKYAEWLAKPTPTYMYICSACPTLCDPIDCSPLGSFVHWILWVRILEWVDISYSRGSSKPRDWTGISCVLCIGRWVLYTRTTWEVPTPTCMPQQNYERI